MNQIWFHALALRDLDIFLSCERSPLLVLSDSPTPAVRLHLVPDGIRATHSIFQPITVQGVVSLLYLQYTVFGLAKFT